MLILVASEDSDEYDEGVAASRSARGTRSPSLLLVSVKWGMPGLLVRLLTATESNPCTIEAVDDIIIPLATDGGGVLGTDAADEKFERSSISFERPTSNHS